MKLTPDEREAVDAALHKVLRSVPFKSSSRMGRFLQVAVEHTLSDVREPLKEYVLGLRVFDRAEDFDPQHDPIVRVEARRLRKKLTLYYQTEGRDDPVLIDFPDRGYVPAFQFRRPEPARGRRLGRRTQLLSGAGICLAGIAIALAPWCGRSTSPPSIVVVPFLNLSPDPANEYIGDGFTDELINALSGIPELHVVARFSAFRIKGSPSDVNTILERLKVQWVLEGSVRKQGDRLRVTAQLSDAGTRLNAWSQTYDATMANLLEVQERIAVEICDALRVRLSRSPRSLFRSPAVSPAAYEAYLKGRYFWRRLTPDALRKSISSLNEAVQIEPTYAAAYAALADSYSVLPQFELEPPGDLLDKCRASADRALALDGNSAEAHFAVGVARVLADRDVAEAERAFLRALELKPTLTAARQAYAVTCLSPTGRHEQAVAELRRVIADDPVSPVARWAQGQTMAFAGRLEDAVRELRLSLELEPAFVYAQQTLAVAYLGRSMYPEALAELGRIGDAGRDDPFQAGLLGYARARSGDKAGAERILEQLMSRSYVPPMEIAGIVNGLDRRDEALRWLERAYQDRSPLLMWVAVDPRFASLRNDRSFVTLLERLGLSVSRSGSALK